MQKQSGERIQATLDAFNSIGDTGEGMQRLAFTKEDKQVQHMFIDFCKQAGMHVTRDQIGNIIAKRKGALKDAPAVAIGSHLDTVYNAGKFDGTAGIVIGLELIYRLNEKNTTTLYPIELICFVAEESARFGMSTIGSKAMAGKLSMKAMEKSIDSKGISLLEAVKSNGADISSLHLAKRKNSELLGFIELHIEQGLELEQSNKKIGIATAIAAPTRLHVEVKGRAAHSGSTSMEYRKDALVAAAQLVLAVEEAAIKEKRYKTVATVGVFDVYPGAMNVVPGRVSFKVDIRGQDIASKQRIIDQLQKHIERLEEKDGIFTTTEVLSDEKPIILDADMQHVLKQACKTLSIESLALMSGAGHDAMNMALICPTALVFIPSYKGISHHPEEFTSIKDMVIGADVLEEAVLQLANVKEGMVKNETI
ncbi:M20 family metallo-hydrolase [Paraliobacillus sediminis]|uniref:M20 family metallo-hydrolase n=1 Tax=Paraliobacillus sediminis TaxID=1885916 RepID=UPI000E3D252E|nr:M20 family metallo-hydrolase [Paraliobacillus sediminis]